MHAAAGLAMFGGFTVCAVALRTAAHYLIVRTCPDHPDYQPRTERTTP